MRSDNLHQVEERESAMCRHNINSKNRCEVKGARKHKIRSYVILVLHVLHSNEFITSYQFIFSVKGYFLMFLWLHLVKNFRFQAVKTTSSLRR